MQRTARAFLLVVALMVVAILGGSLLFERVPPATIGVKQNLLGGGVVEHDYPMGFHLGVAGVHRWTRLDARTHFLNYSEAGEDDGEQNRPALEIRTKDNNSAFFDVTVTYRIKPGEGHRIVMAGNQLKYRMQADTAITAVLRAELAQLSSEEVYDTDTRLALVERAMPKLVEAMSEYHLEPGRFLIRAVNFPAQYEEKLLRKQLTYQQKLLAVAKTSVNVKRAETEGYSTESGAMVKKKTAEWDLKLETARAQNTVEVATILAEAEKYAVELQAETDADYETAIAEGQLAIEKAEALRNELRNQALDTVGGRIYLAQQAAENLQFESVTLNSNDPAVPSILDIDALVELLMGAGQ